MSNYIVVAAVCGLYGVKGEVKLFSYTEPRENLQQYHKFFIQQEGENDWQPVALAPIEEKARHLTTRVNDCADRDLAASYIGAKLAVLREDLPKISSEHSYYWTDLVGCTVVNLQGQQLGIVTKLEDNGAQSILVVKDAAVKNPRLIPFIVDLYIKDVNVAQAQITVDWGLDW